MADFVTKLPEFILYMVLLSGVVALQAWKVRPVLADNERARWALGITTNLLAALFSLLVVTDPLELLMWITAGFMASGGIVWAFDLAERKAEDENAAQALFKQVEETVKSIHGQNH